MGYTEKIGGLPHRPPAGFVSYAASDLIYGQEVPAMGYAHVPLPPGQDTCQLELDFQVLDTASCIYPPTVRVTSLWLEDGATMGYANLYSLPAGAFALVFLLSWGLFLLGALRSRPDGSLLVLALAAGLLTVHEIAQGCGSYFLPEWANNLFVWAGFTYLIPMLLLLYLFLNRKRGFLKTLGLLTLCSLGALAVCAAVSALRGGYLSSYLAQVLFLELPQGIFSGLLHWLTVYLTLSCAAISVLGLVRTLGQLQAEARAMEVRQKLAVESYQNIREQNRRTDTLRHEWKNQTATLHLLLREGKLDQLEERLSHMEGALDTLSPRTYTEHFAINAILQNAAAKAAGMGVSFHGQATVPKDLNVREEDLCALLLNMLDNALEAASHAQQKEVWCKLAFSQGFLAVQCENTYAGEIRQDEDGQLLSTKEESQGHGLGVSQMRAVAEKYHSVLDLSWDGQRFTVQTALQAR